MSLVSMLLGSLFFKTQASEIPMRLGHDSIEKRVP